MATTTAQPAQTPVIEKEDNEYVLVVKKRVRNYKKKLTNISNIEAKLAKKESINKEQEDALRAKDSTTKIVTELENIEVQLLQVKKQEQQKQFSVEDVKNLILLFQSQHALANKRPEGITDQQFKHLNSSVNSLSRHNTKWSLDETCRHALKLVRDSDIKTGLSKVFHVDASKVENADETKEGKAEMTPSQSQEAPTTTVAPVQPTQVETAPVVSVTTTTQAPVPTATEPATQETATTEQVPEEQQFTSTGRGPHRGRSGSGKFKSGGGGGNRRSGSFNNGEGGNNGKQGGGNFKKQHSENKGEGRKGPGNGGARPPKQTASAPAPQN